MIRNLLMLLFLSCCCFVSNAQLKQLEQYVTQKAWKVTRAQIKYAKADPFEDFKAADLESCLFKGTYRFAVGGKLVLEVDKTLCGMEKAEGKWSISQDLKKFSMQLGTEETVVFAIEELTADQIILQQAYPSESGTGYVYERTIYTPLSAVAKQKTSPITDPAKTIFKSDIELEVIPSKRHGILASEMHQMISSLKQNDYILQMMLMGFEPDGENKSQKFYSFKKVIADQKSPEGQLILFYNEEGKTFNKVSYFGNWFNSSKSWFEGFRDNKSFYIVEQKLVRYKEGADWKIHDKFYKDGFVFEVEEARQYFQAYKATPEDLKQLEKNYPGKDYLKK